MPQSRRVLVSLSGGMDSATLLAEAKHQNHEVHCVSFNYGSKHAAYEMSAAEQLVSFYKVPWTCIDISMALVDFQSALLLTGADVPEGHYKDPKMKKTVVPCRNLILISFLAGLADSHQLQRIWFGMHLGDYAIYPDCRPEFVSAAAMVVRTATESRVDVEAPFLYYTKSDILQRGITLRVPYHLTRTCYKNQQKACGKCGACYERLEAFAVNNTIDPLEYK